MKQKWKIFIIIFLLFVFSFIVHCMIIPLTIPNAVVFDETYFGDFINNYIKQEFFFDIHPPLAKLILYAYAKYVVKYDGSFNFTVTNGNYNNISLYSRNLNKTIDYDFYSKIRFVPAFLCSFVTLFLVLTLINRNVSILNSILCGLVSLFDCLKISQSRLILTDGILYFFVSLTILITSFIENNDKNIKNNRKMMKNNIKIFFLIFFQSLTAGCAFSTKFTAGGLLVYIGFSHILIIYYKYLSKQSTKFKNDDYQINLKMFLIELFFRGIFCIFIVFSVVLFSFYMHFKILINSGKGDEYVACTNRNDPENCIFHSLPFFRKFYVMIRMMLYYNSNVSSQHPYASKWFQWPFGLNYPILVYSKNEHEFMYFYISPVACFISLLGFIFSIYYKQIGDFIGYFSSLIGFIFMQRVTFLYHYEIPLLFGLISFFTNLDKFSIQDQKTIQIAILILSLFIYIIMFPQIYCVYSPFYKLQLAQED